MEQILVLIRRPPRSTLLPDTSLVRLLIKCPRTDRDYTRIITALINGDFENDLMIFRKIRRADITALTETDWTLDGEYGGHPEKIRFDIRYDAVRIMTAGK